MVRRTNISGYLIVAVDHGQGVVYLDVIYVIDNIFGSDSKMLFGKLFLAIINATIGIQYDYLVVPFSDGAAIHILGQKYLGKGIWEKVQFPKLTQVVLSKSWIVKAHQKYAVEYDMGCICIWQGHRFSILILHNSRFRIPPSKAEMSCGKAI